ncbi:MAG TPA: hypothetical protein VN778_05665 [Verrucomicrobiae bacterium]|nr:hypothetical protein [Verrucomicrobiae bacterium]
MKLQNKFIMGALSFLILASAGLFVMQPTVAHADAVAQVQFDKKTGQIVMFGGVNLTSGEPEQGVRLSVAATRQNDGGWGHRRSDGRLEILDSTTTDSSGRFKLWVNPQDSRRMHPGVVLTLLLRPHDSHQTYQEDLLLKAGDVASITVAMRTPLVPIFPFTVFVY